MHLVKEEEITEQAFRYLKSFTDEVNCITWKAEEEEDEETTALRQLVADLKQDLNDLRLDYHKFQDQANLEFNAEESTAGLMDEI